jgi:ketosteroid isomerase-like protein
MKLQCVAVGIVLVLHALASAQQSPDEQAVWTLEHSYWEYVKAQDVEKYKGLWHDNFLGWPSYSPQPVRKDQIPDWFKNYKAKGLALETYDLKLAGSQLTGNIVVVHYLVTAVWTKKDGSEQAETRRISHTWLRTEKGWLIIGGMSATERGGTN